MALALHSRAASSVLAVHDLNVERGVRVWFLRAVSGDIQHTYRAPNPRARAHPTHSSSHSSPVRYVCVCPALETHCARAFSHAQGMGVARICGIAAASCSLVRVCVFVLSRSNRDATGMKLWLWSIINICNVNISQSVIDNHCL